MEKKCPRVVANVKFTLRHAQCEAAGLDRHSELYFEWAGYRQWELCIDLQKTQYV